MAVGILDVVIDFLDQVFHATERSAANGLLRNTVEPDLHLIEPGGIGGSAVHMEPCPCSKPAFHSQMLVRGVIINDDVHLQAFRHALLTLPETTHILLMPM